MNFLATGQRDELRTVLSHAEVPLQGLAADRLISVYTDECCFKAMLENIGHQSKQITLSPPNPLFSSRNHQTSRNLAKKANEIYDALYHHHEQLLNKKPSDGDSLLVSELISLLRLFQGEKGLFADIINILPTPSSFEYFLDRLLYIRNSLNHPASYRILVNEAEFLLRSLQRILDNFDEKYFWEVNKKTLLKEIQIAWQGLIAAPEPSIIHNLDDNASKYPFILYRDHEVNELSEYLLGGEHRKVASVLLHGYGGVGKSSIAMEFCLRMIGESLAPKTPFQKIVWLSAKNEQLEVNPLHGGIESVNIKSHYSSYRQFVKIFTQLAGMVSDEEEVLWPNSGEGRILAVIDNLETLSLHDQREIINFVHKAPSECVSFIITGREFIPNAADRSILVDGFPENIGLRFIKDYCLVAYGISPDDTRGLSDFLSQSRGNALILVLGIMRFQAGLEQFDTLAEKLKNVRSSDVEALASFMYRNIFDSALENIRNRELGRKVLNILLFYGEPISPGSVSKLSGYPKADVENVLNLFANRFIVTKQQEFYEVNDMAERFIRLRLLDDEIQQRKLIAAISEYKAFLRARAAKLNEQVSNSPELNRIFEDWAPGIEDSYSTDELWILDAFELLPLVRRRITQRISIREVYQKVHEEFEAIINESYHPYVHFQYASALVEISRVLSRGSNDAIDACLLAEIRNKTQSEFEQALFDIECSYTHVRNTVSHGVVLVHYGLFCLRGIRDYAMAMNNFHAGVNVLERFNDRKEELWRAFEWLVEATLRQYISKRYLEDYLYEAEATLIKWDSVAPCPFGDEMDWRDLFRHFISLRRQRFDGSMAFDFRRRIPRNLEFLKQNMPSFSGKVIVKDGKAG